MSAKNPAHDPQWIAADPAGSRFVTANAGSGKTKTLIDRVARLLLGQAAPEAILCVTYTKAAAAEMQRRLFARLGGWAVMADAALRQELSRLTGDAPGDFDDREISEARALFARALETPGGLKIQTIHAFCEKLLRRFPLEAGVSPGFEMLDDAGSAAVALAARRRVAARALAEEGRIAEAYARFSVALDYAAFQSMFAAFEQKRGGLAAYLDRCGGLDGAILDVWSVCGFSAPASLEEIAGEALAALDVSRWRATAEVLAQGGKTDQKCAENLYAFTAEPSLEGALSALFTAGGEGTPATWPAKTSGLAARPDLREALLDDQAMLEEARARLRGAKVASDTADALVLASAYLNVHEQEKLRLGALDFTDLVEKTRHLLTEKADAAWVLYKLDGGIDHILVDEAQDTAPDQWAIIRALTEDFFAGAGAPGYQRRSDRTLFVVGDDKQSIYSFQGADPAQLAQETDHYLARIEDAAGDGRAVPLTDSWRSTVEVLAYVDAVFAAAETRAAVPPPKGQDVVAHIGRREGHQGCVDLWPLEVEIKEEEREAWDAPLDQVGPGSADRRLAERIAAEVFALVARGDLVFDKERGKGEWRPAGWGDVLILVRRRKALFEEILRALKRRRIPVAGADRLALSGHIAFDDLMALARFCLYPDDDLTLAAVLKSPFCGWDDDRLYALAHGREGRLWRSLRDAGPSEALDFLQGLRREARNARPFEFYSRLLGLMGTDGRSMKSRVLQRLGSEAEEAVDEFLAQVLAAEDRGVRDLESLVAAFASLDIVVKRELDQPKGEVRVMTAHGSKGLEAPIVILPEIALRGGGRGSPLLETEAGGFLWCSSKADDGDASSEARAWRDRKAQEESLRLLYVALTRARDRLVLCGRIAADAKEENLKDWYAVLKAAFAAEGLAPHVRQAARGDFVFTRYGPDPETGKAAPAEAPALTLVPAWLRAAPPAEPQGLAFVSPSLVGRDEEAGVARPAPSPLSVEGGLGRYRRGEIIHRLLQLLPDLAPEARPAAAARILEKEPGLSPEQQAEMAGAALGVLADPQFAEVFAPGSRAEAAVAGTAPGLPQGLAVSGRIDRMTITPERVLVVDFKTNRPAPARIEDADPAYLTQMAVYWAVLSAIFPGRQVEAALVWTDGPRLMPVPQAVIDQRLVRLRTSG